MNIDSLVEKISLPGLEAKIIDFVARFAPWLAPLPTAYLTATATIKHLSWPPVMGMIAGVIIELLGLASVATALELREFNATRRQYPVDWTQEQIAKSKKVVDPAAPFGLAVALGGVYFASVVLLTVLLDTLPELARGAPIIFPVLSLAGVTVLGIRADHRRRLEKIAAGNDGRKRGRSTGTLPAMLAQAPKKAESLPVTVSAESGSLDTNSRAAAYLAANPGISGSELGRKLGLSDRTGRKIKAALIQQRDDKIA